MQCCQVLELKIHSMFSLEKLHLNCDANMGFLTSRTKFKRDSSSALNMGRLATLPVT
jgi:hypothetical protein